ncbi:MAG: tetratricopeptide repeat protein [Gammaproteobacteria bacterium]
MRNFHDMTHADHRPAAAALRTLAALLLLACLAGCATLPGTSRVPVATAALDAAAQVMETGDLQRARALVAPLLAQDATHDNLQSRVAAMHILLRVHTIMGDRAAMRETAASILDAEASDPSALEVLGLLALEELQLDIARDYLTRAVQIDARRWSAWNALGIVADEQQNYAEAAMYFERGLAIVPAHPRLLANLGWSQVLAGELQAGEQLLRRSLETAPDSLVTRSNLAFVVALQGNYEDARKLYGEIYDPAVAANNVGYAALLRRDRHNAEDYLREAISLKPSFYEKASNNLKIAYER